MKSVVQWAGVMVAIVLEIGRSCRSACWVLILSVGKYLQGFSGLTGWLTSVRRVQISSNLALVGSIPTVADFLFLNFWSLALSALNAIGVNAIGAAVIIAVVVITGIKTSSVKTVWNRSKPVVLNVLLPMVLSQMSRRLQNNQLLWFILNIFGLQFLGTFIFATFEDAKFDDDTTFGNVIHGFREAVSSAVLPHFRLLLKDLLVHQADC